MWILEPLAIEAAQVTASNILEDEFPAWSAGSYADKAVVIHDNSVFESLLADNAAEPGTDDAKWFRRSATNKFKPFDQGNSSQAQAADMITYTVNPGSRVDMLAFISLAAIEVQVEIYVPGTVAPVYSSTRAALRSENRSTFYDWCFGGRDYRRSLVFNDIPTYVDQTNATIEITVSNAGGLAMVGEILFGKVWKVGKALYETAPRLRSFSIDTRDDFGNLVSTKRRATRAISYRFLIDTAKVDYTLDRLENLTATKLLFLGGDGIERFGTTLFGTFRDFNTPIEGPNGLTGQIDVEGFIA